MVRRMAHSPAAIVSAVFGVSVRTARKRKKRYQQGGVEALADRSSRSVRCRSKLTESIYGKVFALRKQRLTGDDIAASLGLSRSTVFRILRKLDCARLSSLEEKLPVRRYQWEKPGQMLHLDIKRLGKIDGVGHRKTGTRQVPRRRPGWEYLHVCVDDASRVACTGIYPDETAESAVEFLWCAVLPGMPPAASGLKEYLQIMGPATSHTNSGKPAVSFGIRHKRTRPYRPQTNGKAEQFIRTALKEWAYAQTYTHSWKRTVCLPRWTQYYNFLRPHSALGRKPPASILDREGTTC